MRRPIHIQLLLPMLGIVVLAIALVSAANAVLGIERARLAQEENLRRVVTALSEASFPLTENVLRQMAGLSGAEFVLLDHDGRLRHGTLALDARDSRRLAGVPEVVADARFSDNAVITLAGRDYMSSRVPVQPRGSAPADSLVVLYAKDRWWAATRRVAYPGLLAGAVAVVAAVLITTVLAHRFVRPIRQLRHQVAAVADGDFRPVRVEGCNDEIRDLAASVNQMADRLGRYEEEVRRSERLRTLGQLGAGMAHQLRNAATGAAMAIELHRGECDARPDSESLAVASRQLKLMETYLQRFLALGQSRPVVMEPLALDILIQDMIGLVRPTCQHGKIDLRFDPPDEPIRVRGSSDLLGQLLVNLLLNAAEAAGRDTPGRGVVRVAIQRVGDDRTAIVVEDSGPGPAETVRDRLFEPFVTEKPEGTGLGLFVSRQVAEDHGGSIRWQRRDGRTCFVVELPTLDGPIDEQEQGQPPTAADGETEN